MSTYWLERSDVANAIIWRDVIHGNSSILSESPVRELFDPFERPVSSPIIQGRSPIIAEIFTESATRTSGSARQVIRHWLHCCIERIASHDLVNVGASYHSGINEGIETLDHKLGASET
jgi:hypothetical protein